jgi:hypothetical protein
MELTLELNNSYVFFEIHRKIFAKNIIIIWKISIKFNDLLNSILTEKSLFLKSHIQI